MIDPERAIWEKTVVDQYGICAARHRATVGAWPNGTADE